MSRAKLFVGIAIAGFVHLSADNPAHVQNLTDKLTEGV